MNNKKPIALIILDGFGYAPSHQFNAISQAHTPNLNLWKKKYAFTQLKASGSSVGLPPQENGNSEVGHFTIGSGKIIPQTSLLLSSTIQFHSLISNHTLMKELKNFNPQNTIHLVGLISNGGVHSNIQHLFEYLKVLKHYNFNNISIHAILDGRDTPPQSALSFLEQVEQHLKQFKNGKIATIHGRHYAMDRDKNDDRITASFNIMTQQSSSINDYAQKINDSYKCNISDEYITPFVTHYDHVIQSDDGVIFFNFRPDRAKQITQKLLSLPLNFFITPVIYDSSLPTKPLIKVPSTTNTLLEIINNNNKQICTITETEKFNHLTYFFNGHRNISLPHEHRIMIPSHKVQRHDQKPEMKAQEITDQLISCTQKNKYDFFLLNFANADMVGHTGNLQATIKAVECIDTQLKKIYEEIVIKHNGTLFITADHGNAEKMFDQQSQQPCTSHTNNKVPFYAINTKEKDLTMMQGLSDIATIILRSMNINA